MKMAMGTERMDGGNGNGRDGDWQVATEQLLARTVDRYDYVETRHSDTPNKVGGIGVESNVDGFRVNIAAEW